MTTDTTSHLDLTLMVAFHDAFRRDLGHLARAAGRRPAELEEPARHTAVLAGWELFKTQLHIHHTAEDQDLWPRMRTHLADRLDQLALLQAMQDEHARIDPLLDAVDGALADQTAATSASAAPSTPWPASCMGTCATRSATCCR
jgi:Hemerythrin HHE cation binding domain